MSARPSLTDQLKARNRDRATQREVAQLLRPEPQLSPAPPPGKPDAGRSGAASMNGMGATVSPLDRLRGQGLVLIDKRARTGLTLTIAVTELRLSIAARAHLGEPSAVFVLLASGLLALIAADPSDPRAFRVNRAHPTHIPAGAFVRRLRAEGWELGRYRVKAEPDVLLVTKDAVCA